jgi:hypothetical protein
MVRYMFIVSDDGLHTAKMSKYALSTGTISAENTLRTRSLVAH